MEHPQTRPGFVKTAKITDFQRIDRYISKTTEDRHSCNERL